MPSPDVITVPRLRRLVGLPEAPTIIDVRTEEDCARDPRLLPASLHRDYRNVTTWADAFAGRSSVIVCQRGMKLSQGVAAWIRLKGGRAEVLEGGFEAWSGAADAPLILPDHLPPRDADGRTVWVTRTRPKIDRIAWRRPASVAIAVTRLVECPKRIATALVSLSQAATP
jgi:rhodanese-related sulfurtransferase